MKKKVCKLFWEFLKARDFFSLGTLFRKRYHQNNDAFNLEFCFDNEIYLTV